jgi:hypothetical protein
MPKGKSSESRGISYGASSTSAFTAVQCHIDTEHPIRTTGLLQNLNSRNEEAAAFHLSLRVDVSLVRVEYGILLCRKRTVSQCADGSVPGGSDQDRGAGWRIPYRRANTRPLLARGAHDR